MNKDLTVVTGLWDLGRGNIDGWSKRSFETYKERFLELLTVDVNMCIFIPKSLELDVWNVRKPENTKVYIKEISDFETWFPFFDKVENIRTSKDWKNTAGWLAESPQALLKHYNPMQMSKMFMLHDVSIFNPFSTNYFLWLDGGLTSTVHKGYFTNDNILDKITPYLNKFLFLSFPYENTSEIHGFKYEAMQRYCKSDVVNYVCRGGLFGGSKKTISKANALYYNILNNTLTEGYMGADECLYTIMAHIEPETYIRSELSNSALISHFAEALKNDTVTVTANKTPSVAVYVISFNSPAQFQALIDSWQKNSSYITNTDNYLLDNSNDLSTTPMYEEICKVYNFKHIKKDNIGICGGRQFVAEHFNETTNDYYIFLEDDMMLNAPTTELCSNNFPKYVPNLYENLLDIMKKENYDFIKMSFAEFYGNNSTQWAWYNVPQSFRESNWPNNPKLPATGLDPNSPSTNFKNIKTLNRTTYADGEVYYCNWPQIVSREGNYKIFLITKYAHPHEQTMMSYVYQETLKGNIKPAILLASPITHNRFDHYKSGLRKEC